MRRRAWRLVGSTSNFRGAASPRWRAPSTPSLPIVQRIAPGTERYKLELGRAERLFRARLYEEALQAYETLRASASGDDGELVNLRIAECHYFQGRLRDARDGVKPYISKASRQAEALFFHALAVGRPRRSTGVLPDRTAHRHRVSDREVG